MGRSRFSHIPSALLQAMVEVGSQDTTVPQVADNWVGWERSGVKGRCRWSVGSLTLEVASDKEGRKY